MTRDPLLWDAELAWSDLATATGDARDVPAAVRALSQAMSKGQAEAAYWRLDNVVVVHGSVFEVAPHLVGAILRLALEGGSLQRRWGLELLLQVAGGWTDPGEQERLGLDLVDDCRQRLRRGIEALYLLAADDDRAVRELAVEIVANVEDRREVFERRLSWMISECIDPEERSFLEGILCKNREPGNVD